MKIVIAPDSFKEALSSKRAAKVLLKALKLKNKNAHYEIIPISDGGEGLLNVLAKKQTKKTITGPLGEKTKAHLGFLDDGKTIVIEMAEAAGLEKVKSEKRDPNYTTTYGVGELLIEALKYKPKKIILGLGGSATNDLGIGALIALGIKFYDDENNEVGIFGKDIFKITKADFANCNKELKEVKLILATDVKNPLLKENGATFVYGPQKGLKEEELIKYDEQFKVVSKLLNNHFKKDLINSPGAGAAGGIAYSLATVFGGIITSGFDVVYQELKIEEKLINADYLITAEGKVDAQTLSGKAPYEITLKAKAINPNIKAILFVGTNHLKTNNIFDKIVVINDSKLSLKQNIKKTKTNLFEHGKTLL